MYDMTTTTALRNHVEAQILTPEACAFLTRLAREFEARRQELRPPDEARYSFLGRGNREQEICRKECKLDQAGPGVVQVKNRFEVGDENVVESSHKSPHEEQRRDDNQSGPSRG